VSRVGATGETETSTFICEFCGGKITNDEQRCPATDDGRRCRP